MKKVFTFLTLFFLTSVVWAADVVFVAGVDNGDRPGTAAPYTIIKDGVTVSVTDGFANDTQYRVYKNQTITICSQVGNISKIVFECVGEGDAQYGPACFVVSIGDYSCEGKIGVWTGCDPCVTFKAATYQVRITRIIVTVGECDGLNAPVIRPVSGTYYDPIEVSMTCSTSDAVIHYTTDGSDPDEQSSVYTAAFIVNHNMTVKAVSVLDDDVSGVVTATYVIMAVPVVNCFEDLESVLDETIVRFSSPVYALAQHNRYLFAKDGCDGYGLFYGDVGQTYRTGDVIPAGFVATKTTYSGEMELLQPTGFQPATQNITIEPEKITPDQAGHDLFAHYVIVENVMFVTDDGRNYYAVDTLGNRIPVYTGTLGYPLPPDLSLNYDVTGIIGSYGRVNVIYQLLPTDIRPHDGVDSRIGLGDLDRFVGAENPNVTLGYDATVIGQSGNYLYLMDETGYGLVYGNVRQTYQHGDVVPAGYGGKVTEYSCNIELTQPVGFNPPIGHVNPVAEEITALQVDERHCAHFVVIKQVTRGPDGVLYDRNGNVVPIAPNRPFGCELPAGLPGPFDIYGVIGGYRVNGECRYQFLLLDFFPKPDPPKICCIEEMLAHPIGTICQFECPLIVIYQNGVNLYVKDQCGYYTLMYGNNNGEFVNGDRIIGSACLTRYQEQLQLSPVGDWTLVGHGPIVEPEEFACIEELSQDMCHWYICLKNVKIVDGEDGNTYLEDECGLLLLYNKFGMILPGPGDPIVPPRDPYDLNGDGEVGVADINFLIDLILSGKIEYDWYLFPTGNDDGERTYDVTGFLTIYRGQLEFYPVFMTAAGASELIVGDLNRDNEVNVADLNELLNRILSQ